VLDLGVRHVMVWYRASDVYQRHVLGGERATLLDGALGAIRAAKERGAYVNLFMPESTRMGLDQLRDTAIAAEQAGADAFTLVDSLAICRPAALGFLVSTLKSYTSKPVEVHCHNDYGLATACVLAAYEAGADALNNVATVTSTTLEGATGDESATALTTVIGDATMVVTSSANPSEIGQPVTFKATVSSSNGSPTGSVTFALDSVSQAPITLSGGERKE